VGKDRIIGIVSDAVSPQIAQTLTKLKKGEMVKAAEKHLAGLRWLPETLKNEYVEEKVANPKGVRNLQG
jgi:ParB family chromosome partitioning protein